MDAQLLVAFVLGSVVSALGLALGIYARLRMGAPDPRRMTFHRPAPGVLIIEIRATISATYGQAIREWFEEQEPETHVLVVCLED